MPATQRLSPPFSRENSIPCTASPDHSSKIWIVDPQQALPAYLRANLLTPRVNQIHSLLWLAGLPRPARPLHRQRLLQRELCPTEDPNEHLVWHDGRIFLKPLPAYLLDYDVWAQHLVRDPALHASAHGLLLSYTWLVAHPSDLRLALEGGLLPPALTWPDWVACVGDVLRAVDTRTLRGVDPRYSYGELRLSRLNSLYRLGFAMGGPSMRCIVTGFLPRPSRYNTFFERHFSWIVVTFVYLTVLLSALQVALATERLAGDARFQALSCAVALLALVFVLAVLLVMAVVWVVLFWYHLSYTRRYCKKVKCARQCAVA